MHQRLLLLLLCKVCLSGKGARRGERSTLGQEAHTKCWCSCCKPCLPKCVAVLARQPVSDLVQLFGGSMALSTRVQLAATGQVL